MVKRKILKFGEFQVRPFKSRERAREVRISLKKKGIKTKGFFISGTHFIGAKGKDLKLLKKMRTK